MILPKQFLKAHLSASKDEARQALNHIKVTEKDGKITAVATDSYMLYEVTGPSMDDKEFPLLLGVDQTKTVKDAFIGIGAAKKLISAMPRYAAIQVLKCAQILEGVAIATDLETSAMVRTASTDIKFPDYEKLFPIEKPTASVTVSAKLLQRMCELMQDADEAEGIKLHFYSKKQPLVATKEESGGVVKRALVMPMRDDD